MMARLPKMLKILLILSIPLISFLLFPSSAFASEYSWERLATLPAELRDLDTGYFDASIMYAALSTGLYRSEDGGLSWSLFAFGGRSVTAVAVHPRDSSVVFASVWNEENSKFSLYRLSDGSWSDPLLESPSYYGFNKIYIDRMHPGFIYTATWTGQMYRSTHGGDLWQEASSLPYIYDFAVSPSDPFKIYAAAGSCGLYNSDDGGETWSGGRPGCSGSSKINNVDIDPFGGAAVFSLTGGGPTFPNCLFRWVGEGPSATLYRQCVGNDVLFNPYVRDEVFFSGVNVSARHFVKRSTESGDEGTWQMFEEGLPSSPSGPYVSEFFIHNSVPYLYAVVGGGLYRAQVGPMVVADRPVILVPGMGASFNPSLFFGHGPNDWAWTPGVQVYDGLLASLENAGYVRDRNLFVAFYDWRAPMMESSCEYLKPVVEEARLRSGADKVWLVGHSQGGLLSRAYIQGDCYGGDVEKLVTLGTPHMGAADAYFAWEGTEFKGYEGFYIPLNIYLTVLQIRQKMSRVQVIHNLLPSLKEILPIYDFLKMYGTLIAWDSLHEVNDFLPDLNAELPNLLDMVEMTTISGNGNETSKFIKVTERSEAVGDKWIDGQPVDLNPIEFGDGDGRVLKSSSLLAGSATQVAEGLNHGELVGLKAGQKKLFASLGVELDDSQYVESPPFDAILGFFLGSPATLLVTDAEGNKVGFDPEIGDYVNELDADIWGENEEEKWIIIPNPDSEEYTVQVFPVGEGGVYHLLVSYESDQSQGWEEITGEALGGEEPDEVNFIISPENEEPLAINDPKGSVTWEEIKILTSELKETITEWHLPI